MSTVKSIKNKIAAGKKNNESNSILIKGARMHNLKNVTVLEQNGSTGNGEGKGSDAIRCKTHGYGNVLGTPNFGQPVTTAGGVFGSGGPRAFQFAARFTF